MGWFLRFACLAISFATFSVSAYALHALADDETPPPKAATKRAEAKAKPPVKVPELKLDTTGSVAIKHFKTSKSLECPKKESIDTFHDLAKQLLTYHRTKGEDATEEMQAMRKILEEGVSRPWRAEDFDDPTLRWPGIAHTLSAAKKRVTDATIGSQIDLVIACVEHLQHEFDETKKKVFAGDPIPKDAIPFEEKFKRQQKGTRGHVFKPGETILGSLILEDVFDAEGRIKEDEVRFLIADDNSDVRNSDSFVVKIGKDKRRALQALKGFPLEGALKIKAPIGENGAIVSNMFSYEAEIVAIKSIAPVNPPAKKLDTLANGSSAVIEGEVVKLYSAKGDPEQPTHMYVKQPDGTIAPVTLSSGLPKFESDAGSGVENVAGKPVKVGDKVRVRGTVRPSRGTPFAGLPAEQAPKKDPEKVVDASWTRSTYLREASKERREEYESDRDAVKAAFESSREYLKNEDWVGLRQILSQILPIELTAKEKEQLEALRMKMPEDKRPVRFNEKYYAKEIDAGFGVQIDLMTKAEFVELAMRMARGEIKHDEKHGSASEYIVRLLDNKDLKLSKDQQREILMLIAETRLKAMEKLKKENPDLKAHDIPFSERYMIERAATYLATSKDPKSAEVFLENLGRFADADTINAVQALRYAFDEARTNPKIMAAFHAKKAKLLALSKKLAAAAIDPKSHDGARGVASRHNDEVLGILSQLDFEEPGKFEKLVEKSKTDLAGRHPFFKSSLAEMKKRGYEIVRLDDPKAKIPDFIRDAARGGQVGAMTDKEDKRIYLVTGVMAKLAQSSGSTLDAVTAEVLANELVHVVSDLRSEPLGKDDAVSAIEALRDGEKTFKGEANFYDVLEEEVVSEVVSREAKRLEKGGKGKLSADDLAIQVDSILEPMTEVVFTRHYRAGFREVSGLPKIYKENVVPKATSEKMQKRIADQVRKLGF